MSAPSEPREDLFDAVHRLAHAVLNGRATAAEQQQLEELVVNNEEGRLIYLKYIHDNAALRWAGVERAAIEPLPLAEQIGNSVRPASATPRGSTIGASKPVIRRWRSWSL